MTYSLNWMPVIKETLTAMGFFSLLATKTNFHVFHVTN